MATKTKEQLKAASAATYTSNGNWEISAESVRGLTNDLIDSALPYDASWLFAIQGQGTCTQEQYDGLKDAVQNNRYMGYPVLGMIQGTGSQEFVIISMVQVMPDGRTILGQWMASSELDAGSATQDVTHKPYDASWVTITAGGYCTATQLNGLTNAILQGIPIVGFISMYASDGQIRLTRSYIQEGESPYLYVETYKVMNSRFVQRTAATVAMTRE